jgi:glycosyltransferase involved in cell wall biosynthesis
MAGTLALSVVVPVRDCGETLQEVLTAIRASDLSREAYEIIVVDDLSDDASVAIAARYADTVVRLSGRRAGPAYARNRGVELARGDIVAFVDGDIVVRPDTLPRMLATLRERPEIDAVCALQGEGSGAPNFVSQYWSLLVRFGEQRYAGRCFHFASGCGAVRRNVLVSAGMYDEWRFTTACLEGLEFGQRLVEAGHGVLLSPELKVTHLKRWNLMSVCELVWRRGTLLSRSLGYQRMGSTAPSEVVFTLSRALTPALAILATLTLAAAFLPHPYVLTKGGIAFAAILLTNLPVHRFYASTRGLGFAIASAPLHVFVQVVAAVALCNGWILREVFGDDLPDATTQAYSEVGLEIWPPVRRRL